MPKSHTRLTLDQLEVHEPCHEAWDAMQAVDGTRRHCDACAKHVYDLAKMSRADAERLLGTSGGSACVRFARAAGGRVLTREDFAPQRPAVGWSRRAMLRRVAGLAAFLGFGSAMNLGCKPSVLPFMGSPPPHTADPEPTFLTGEMHVATGAAVPSCARDATTAPAEATWTEPAVPQRTMGIVAIPPRPTSRPAH